MAKSGAGMARSREKATAGSPCRRVRQRGQLLLIDEEERLRIDAMADAGGRRPIVEHVAQVAVAPGAEDFGSAHAMAAVGFGRDILGAHRLEEAWPAGAGVELGGRGEERQLAAYAGVD